ncbi:GNAT family N-acetyltransferase [Sphingomonas sp. QA11]|uniref:GNAT family N-acetyltransferase n=1 Tax=Sphingomonas sp. QA11 TaxID=2950605 RepID=UPI00234A8669|nr:GNAT family N-acetyltransferase [Sphingomonas sp. QA11]WCM28685.1 GNAT family N-acetyltransferase [Sphingomonas sp. QA11]
MIHTDRLVLRRWREADVEPFFAICSDPRVMATIGPLQTRDEIVAAVARQNGFQDQHGFCFWAIERREDAAMVGFCGIKPGAEGTPIEGEVEIGWRLGFADWGKGYAREAATASLEWAWDRRDISAVAAITTVGNSRSWGLMERLGMVRASGEDFDHPGVPDDSPLKPHIVYRIARPA